MAKIFEQMNNWYKNTPAYSMIVTHASYENYTTTLPADKTVGYFKKYKNNYHSFLIGIHTIQNNNYKIVIDTADKIMLVANPDQLIWSASTFNDYLLRLKTCAAIKASTAGSDKRYRFEFKQGPLAYYDVLIDADGLLKEITSYYAKEIKKEENEKNSPKIKPRVSIVFSGYKKNPVFNNKNEFDESRYFIKNGTRLTPVAHYKNFKLHDQRYNKN